MSNGLPPDEPSGGEDSEPRPAGLDRATELELLEVALLGDAQAFSELFEHYRPALYGLCCRRLNDPSLAEDVVQEVFLKALKNLSSYDRGQPVWPWLSTIAYRMCVDLQRHRSLTQYFADLGVALDEDAEVHGHARSALDEVMAAEESAELWKSLEALPKRQRRALLLYAQDGMSYADIAAAEGISIGAVKLLIVRAREKMRAGRPLPAIFLPFTWWRWKLQRIEERVRPLLGVYGEGFSTTCAQVVCLGTVVVMVVATGLSSKSFDVNNALASDEIVVLAMQPETSQTISQSPNIGAPAKPSVNPQQSAVEVTGSLVDYVISPNESATPENSSLDSITVSPNYESDHTIVAAGRYSPGHVVFVSRDGGANWKSLPSRSLLASTVVPSPRYPQDGRLFAVGDRGFQQSDDGGEIFKLVSPLMGWGLAISPSFGAGDSRILIGGKTIVEYDAVTGATAPGLLSIPPSVEGSYPSITFSPGYPADSTVFVSGNIEGTLLEPKWGQTTLYRCKGSACDKTQFPVDGPLKLRLSPRFDRDGLAYAFTSGLTSKLFVSTDEVRTLREIPPPSTDWGYIYGVDVLWNPSSEPAIFVAASGYVPSSRFPPAVYRSLDAGRSWGSSRIDVPGFLSNGANGLIITPTGRLLATGWQFGVACSEDKGKTWAPRCTPEQ